MLFNTLCGFSLGVKFSFCPHVGWIKYWMAESCFLPEGQEKEFSLNYCIRRWTIHFPEERCLYPHTGNDPP